MNRPLRRPASARSAGSSCVPRVPVTSVAAGYQRPPLGQPLGESPRNLLVRSILENSAWILSVRRLGLRRL